jgi:hypothetical protein
VSFERSLQSLVSGRICVICKFAMTSFVFLMHRNYNVNMSVRFSFCKQNYKERCSCSLYFINHHHNSLDSPAWTLAFLRGFCQLSRLGGVMVSILATGPKGCVFEPSQGDGFLRAIKIRSTTSFRLEVKREGPMS